MTCCPAPLSLDFEFLLLERGGLFLHEDGLTGFQIDAQRIGGSAEFEFERSTSDCTTPTGPEFEFNRRNCDAS